MSLVLSIFTGAGLLDRGFTQAGFCVVSAGDIILGHDVREFHPCAGKFEGVIGGSPCQDFSKARRSPPTGEGVELLGHFARCVTEAAPDWFLLENVPGVPDVSVPGFKVQRFNARASEFGGAQHRLRAFQFGHRDAAPIVLRRPVTNPVATQPAALASEGKKTSRRGWLEFCALQGLDVTPELHGLTVAAKYRVIGNGVFVPLACAVATAIKARGVTPPMRVCVCDCGRPVRPGATLATAACRKRMQRRRDAAGVSLSRRFKIVALMAS